MTINERAELAAQLKASGQCNCTQAVLKVFEDILPTDISNLLTMTQGFAAGMGCMESTCGALIGAVMVAGILTNGKGTAIMSKKIVSKFSNECGATICKELKGISTGKVLCPCPECVKIAVLCLEETTKESTN